MYFSGDETFSVILSYLFNVSGAFLAVSSKIGHRLIKSISIFTSVKVQI